MCALWGKGLSHSIQCLTVIVEAGREGESVGKRGGCRNVASDLAGIVETHSLFNGQ